MICNIRASSEAKIGDTLYSKGSENVVPITALKQSKPMVFAGVFPMDQSETPALRSAIEKLTLNDASVSISKDSRFSSLQSSVFVITELLYDCLLKCVLYSAALGQGWRLGFLGLLHMEVFNQRLEQEYGAEVIVTVPSVPYKSE